MKNFLSLFFLLFFVKLSFANLIPSEIEKINIPFIENNGQFSENISFFANTFYGSLYLTKKGEMIYKLPKTEDKLDAKQSIKTAILKERLIGTKEINIRAEQKLNTKISYYISDKKDNWISNINSFKQISLGEIYKNIQLKLRASAKNIEKIFFIAPGGRPKDIKIKIDNAKIKEINSNGELEIETSLGLVRFTRPIAYQKEDNKQVKIAYYIYDEYTYGFKVGDYDKSKTLVIDPLLASTFVGGGNLDKAYTMALDSEGNIFVAGETQSPDLPGTEYGYDKNITSNTTDIFILKISNNLKNLISATYLGGGAFDTAKALALDSKGNVFITGYTLSPDFPQISGSYDNTYNYSYDVFIAKFDNNLEKLISSTYIGGSSSDEAVALTVDSNYNIIVTGKTNSSNFPTTNSSYRDTNNGDYDVFISKLDSDLTNLISSTYIGGKSTDEVKSITIDNYDNIIITGNTLSENYPVTQIAYDISHNGMNDIFVSILDSNLSELKSSTFIGGTDNDYSSDIKIDSSGNIFVGGYTSSYNFLPNVASPYKGQKDAILIKFDSKLENLLGATYIGGSSDDYLTSIAIDNKDQVFITGYTNSQDFPTKIDSFDSSHNGIWDVFVAKFDNSLSNFLASTYLGGYDSDYAVAITIDKTTNVMIAGYTLSQNFPTTNNIYDSTINGSYDVFISKLNSTLKKGIYTLLVLKVGSGNINGVVISTPTGINCGNDCSEVYPLNTTVVLTAQSTSGAIFTGWSGDCSGINTTCTVVLDRDITVIANFNLSNNTSNNTNPNTSPNTIPTTGSSTTATSTSSPYQEINACFIATAVYDSPYAPEVIVLREFRDKYLLKNDFGRLLTKIYYTYSPTIAKKIERNYYLKTILKFLITPIVYLLIYPIIFFIFLTFLLVSFFIKFKKQNFRMQIK